VLVAPSGSVAHAAAGSSVVMFSDRGDYIGGGQERLFHDGNAAIAAQGDTGRVGVGVSGGTAGDYFSLEFAAP
jgi:hypothetical protein